MIDIHVITTFLIILIGLFLSLIKSDNNYIIRKIYLFIVTIILILESGLRSLSVGGDTLTYYNSFQNIKNSTWNDIFRDYIFFANTNYESRDIGYLYFQKAFQFFSEDFRVYLIFIATLFFSSLYFFLLRNTKNIFELILAYTIYSALFYYFFSITGIKQTITTSIAIYSFKFIKDKKFLKFIFSIVLASFIHFSSLIFLPFYFISRLKKIKLNFMFALFIFVIVFIFKKDLVTLLITGTYYEVYLSELLGEGTLVFTSLLFLVIFASYFVISYMKRNYIYYQIYYNAILIALILVPLTWVNSNAMRMVQYYSIYMMIFIPKLVEAYFFKDNFIKKTVYFVLILFLFSFILTTTKSYTFFWDDGNHFLE